MAGRNRINGPGGEFPGMEPKPNKAPGANEVLEIKIGPGAPVRMIAEDMDTKRRRVLLGSDDEEGYGAQFSN
jgi:hypothetical protein